MVVEGGGATSSSASEAFRFPPVTWSLVVLLLLLLLLLLVVISAREDDDEEEEASCELVTSVVDTPLDPVATTPVGAVSCCIGGGALRATFAHTVRKHSINGMKRMVRAERVAGSNSNPSFASAPGPPEEAACGSSRLGSEG